MANVFAIHSVGSSLISYLGNTYPATLRDLYPCEFKLLSSGEVNAAPDTTTRLSLYLYRVTMNEHLRNVPRVNDPSDAPPPLAIDLHYLLNVWTESAEAESVIFAWAMRQLHYHETLSISDLSPEAGWDPGDVIQLIPAELSNEDMTRIWDAIDPPYRLSVSYIARVVRIDPETAFESGKPVVARRFTVGGMPA